MRSMKKLLLVSLLLNLNESYSQDYFNPLFLGEDVASIEDLSYISSGNNIAPGKYLLYVYVGESYISNTNIEFIENKEEKKVNACFTSNIIDSIPFINDIKNKINSEIKDSNECIDISKYINDFSYDVDLSKLTLKLSIPQIYLKSIRSTLANESDWDDGISALMMNYRFNGSFSKNKDMDDYSSSFINLTNRLNIGPWRLFSNSYYNQSKMGSTTNHDFKSNNTYISRNFNSIKSTLIAGQNVLGSILFDSNPYIGITLATANEMLPDSERGYSPTIKGIAESRSKITIKQNGNILYQEYINPGPYNIDNLNSVGTSGDYEVELTSAEGTVTKYIVPYSSLPNLLRKGSYNYSVSLGQLDIDSAKKNKFIQGSLAIGLALDTTLYAGYQIANEYTATGLGVGKDIGRFGALSVDAIYAQAKIDNNTYNGQSYRILFAKSFSDTGTNIQLTGYRYSTSDYYTFSEANYRNSHNSDINDPSYYSYYSGRKKNSFQVNVAQSLGDLGQLYVWGNIDSYWGSDSKSKNIQIGWNKTFKELNNIMVSASYNKNTYSGNTDNIFYLSLSMPLSNGMDNNRMYLSNSTTYTDSKYNNLTSLYGNALDNRLNYNIYQTVNNNNVNEQSNLNLRYKANVAEFNAGTTYSSKSTEFDYGMAGAVLVHSGGVIFSREANDTAILIEAKGAAGAQIDKNGDNITISNNGYALIPYATAYHYNDIGLSPDSFGVGYDIDSKIIKVAPTRGAISKVVFDVRRGYNFLVSVTYQGKPIKFGTLVINNSDQTTSIANDDSTVYLTGVKSNSSYSIKINSDTTCDFSINYDDNAEMKNINKINAVCK
ncbi:fimbria/pilus outer membrane usher protein [Providencia burhodogranariea]|uniref:Outer membrane usher protein n=1 Tax=Providencia burhodogranariea DSM 19968 TaxID=1141662 RepID=K8WF03_9GAMM|nr:fimbria/pilus outer membrane usher protein [Providencia burhodogranariea]EKT56047.1 outer membrane usher protein [Providencia burhodogranariea DSM 19968]